MKWSTDDLRHLARATGVPYYAVRPSPKPAKPNSKPEDNTKPTTKGTTL